MQQSNLPSQAVLSSKCQVVIPREVRQAARLKPGDRVRFFVIDGVIRLVPIRPLRELAGSLPALTADGLREEDERS